MPLKAPEIHEFVGTHQSEQLNTLAVLVLSLVNFTNHLEKRLDECGNCAAKATATKSAPATKAK